MANSAKHLDGLDNNNRFSGSNWIIRIVRGGLSTRAGVFENLSIGSRTQQRAFRGVATGFW